MAISTLYSAKRIEQQFHTGEEPVLVMCSDVNSIANHLKIDYDNCIVESSLIATNIVAEMPKEWKLPEETVKAKLSQLFDEKWIASVWDNFIECLNENIG